MWCEEGLVKGNCLWHLEVQQVMTLRRGQAFQRAVKLPKVIWDWIDMRVEIEGFTYPAWVVQDIIIKAYEEYKEAYGLNDKGMEEYIEKKLIPYQKIGEGASRIRGKKFSFRFVSQTKETLDYIDSTPALNKDDREIQRHAVILDIWRSTRLEHSKTPKGLDSIRKKYLEKSTKTLKRRRKKHLGKWERCFIGPNFMEKSTSIGDNLSERFGKSLTEICDIDLELEHRKREGPKKVKRSDAERYVRKRRRK